jgi:hypothetical protein
MIGRLLVACTLLVLLTPVAPTVDAGDCTRIVSGGHIEDCVDCIETPGCPLSKLEKLEQS